MSQAEAIAHRGASAYAPENTMPSFDLAVRQGAGWVEHDLQVTADGVLICLHDRTLERTTNVRQVFPHRSRMVSEGGRSAERWFAYDLTLAEVRQLDAGAWFQSTFAGTPIPTFDDLLSWARNRVGVLTELKDPDVYEQRGVDMVALCDAALRRHGLTGQSGASPVMVQSFHEPTVRRAGDVMGGRVPTALLIDAPNAARLLDRGRVTALREFTSGIGPEKSIVRDHPVIVQWAHASDLRVTPWTFREATAAPFDSVAAEMAHHFELGVDAVITDHPDRVPGRRR